MIRRSPTRLELKLEDLNDFDYIQKFEKKKNPTGNVVSCSDAQKLVRQERIGLGFRPIRASSNVGASQSTFTTPPTLGTGSGLAAADLEIPVTPTNNDTTPADVNVTNNSTMDGLNLIPEEDRAQANTNNSNMSLDESL